LDAASGMSRVRNASRRTAKGVRSLLPSLTRPRRPGNVGA
jgi:hypothetical protein